MTKTVLELTEKWKAEPFLPRRVERSEQLGPVIIAALRDHRYCWSEQKTGSSRQRPWLTFLGAEEPSRTGAIRDNGSMIFLSPERGTNHESEPKELFWPASSLSHSLADFGLCSVL
jgi:hypothetical protein